MSGTRASLADLVRRATDDERRRLGPPPSLDELATYAAGELAEEDAERIRDDLTLRPAGREAVLGLAALSRHEPPSEEHRVSDEEIEEAWQRMEADLGSIRAAGAPAAGAPAWLVSLKALFRSPLLVPAMAASCALGIAGAALWYQDRETPRLNVEIFDLVAEDEVVRSGDLVPPNAFHPGAGAFVWNLNLTDLTPYSAYLVEIRDAGDAVVWSGRAGGRTSAGNLNVEVPRGFLAAGSYHVRLFGLRDGERELLEAYRVRVEP